MPQPRTGEPKPKRKESVKCVRHTHIQTHTCTYTHLDTCRHTYMKIERIKEMNHFIRVGNAYDMSTRHENFTRLWECGRGTGTEPATEAGAQAEAEAEAQWHMYVATTLSDPRNCQAKCV